MKTVVPEIGMYVQQWCSSSYYGKIIRINRKTFTVNDGTRYKLETRFGDHYCESNVFKCTTLAQGSKSEETAIIYLR